jgi:hypothetical protein
MDSIKIYLIPYSTYVVLEIALAFCLLPFLCIFGAFGDPGFLLCMACLYISPYILAVLLTLQFRKKVKDGEMSRKTANLIVGIVWAFLIAFALFIGGFISFLTLYSYFDGSFLGDPLW